MQYTVLYLPGQTYVVCSGTIRAWPRKLCAKTEETFCIMKVEFLFYHYIMLSYTTAMRVAYSG